MLVQGWEIGPAAAACIVHLAVRICAEEVDIIVPFARENSHDVELLGRGVLHP